MFNFVELYQTNVSESSYNMDGSENNWSGVLRLSVSQARSLQALN